jgi:hypothetical protein
MVFIFDNKFTIINAFATAAGFWLLVPCESHEGLAFFPAANCQASSQL